MLRHKSPHKSELQNSHKKSLFKKDTYRPQFCKPEFYLINLEVFKLWHSLFSQLCLEQQAQAWIIGMCLLRRPQDWFSGKYPEALVDQSRVPISNESFKHPILLHQLCHGTPIQIPQQLNSEMDIIDLINRYRIKPLPLACQRALSHWAYEIYNIKVVPNIPTPTEVLNFQIQGARILSFKSDFKNDFKNWALFKCNDRDYLSFMLHDLVHADHFFYQNNQLRGQIGFYICMQSILTTSELIQLLKNSEFQEQFEYC